MQVANTVGSGNKTRGNDNMKGISKDLGLTVKDIKYRSLQKINQLVDKQTRNVIIKLMMTMWIVTAMIIRY